MTIKGGARQETVFHTVRILMRTGLSVQEAIAAVEALLHGQLPEDLKDRIIQECQ